MLQDMWTWLEEMMEQFKDFIVENHANPLLWIGLFVAGLAIFALTYNALTKHRS